MYSYSENLILIESGMPANVHISIHPNNKRLHANASINPNEISIGKYVNNLKVGSRPEIIQSILKN